MQHIRREAADVLHLDGDVLQRVSQAQNRCAAFRPGAKQGANRPDKESHGMLSKKNPLSLLPPSFPPVHASKNYAAVARGPGILG
jgi:hypothetical protein